LHRIHSPKLNSWAHLQQVLDAFREHFWASRVIEWLPVAGCIALLARSRRALLLVGSWFVVFLLAKGTYIPASVEDASFFRILMPAFPAYLLLAAAIVLLVPGVRPRPAERPFGLDRRKLTIALTAAFVTFAVLPLGVIAAVPRLHDGAKTAVRVSDNSLVPVSSSIGLTAKAQGGVVRLDWSARGPSAASVFYRVLRKQGAGDGAACPGRLRNAPDSCQLFMDDVGSSRAATFDDRPGRGTWTYRIGVAANWLDDPKLGDIYVVSRPVVVVVR
jgi:hypothetical protein